MASGTETGPHPPCRNYYPRAVVSFESGGQVVALGNISRESQGEDMKVAFAIKHRGTEPPYFGLHVKLDWEPVTSNTYRNGEYLAVLFKYHYDCFDCVHHTANEKEKEEFLGIMLSDAACKEVVNNDRLYVIKLFKKENRGAEASSVVTVWLFEHKNLAFHVKWALDYLETAGLKACYHHALAETETEHERNVPPTTSQKSAAASAIEDSFPTQVDKKDQDAVSRGD